MTLPFVTGLVALLALGASSSLASPFEISFDDSVVAKIDDSGDVHALCSGGALLNLCDLVRETATQTTSASMTATVDAFSVSMDSQAHVAVSTDGSFYACGHNVCEVVSELITPTLGSIDGFFVNDALGVDSNGSLFVCGERNLCALSWLTLVPTPGDPVPLPETPSPTPLPECTETIGYSSSSGGWGARPQVCLAYQESTPVRRTGLATSFALAMSSHWDGRVTVWISEDDNGTPGSVLGVGTSGRIVFDAHTTYYFHFNDAFAIPAYTNAWICAQAEPYGLTSPNVWPLASDASQSSNHLVTVRFYSTSVANDTIVVGNEPPLTTFRNEYLNTPAPSLEIFFSDCECDATQVGYDSADTDWNSAPQMCFVYDALNPVDLRDATKGFSLTMERPWTGRVTTWIALDDGHGSPGLVVGVGNTGNVDWETFVPQHFSFDAPFHLTEGQIYHVCVNGEPGDLTTWSHWPLASDVTAREQEIGSLIAYGESVVYTDVVVGQASPVTSVSYARENNVAPSIKIEFGDCICDSAPIGYAIATSSWNAYPITCFSYDVTTPLGFKGDVASFSVAMYSHWVGRVAGWIVEDLGGMPEGVVLGVANSSVLAFDSGGVVKVDFEPAFSIPPFHNVWLCVQGEPNGLTSQNFWPLGMDGAKSELNTVTWVAYDETIDPSSIIVGSPTPFSPYEFMLPDRPAPALEIAFEPCA